MPATTNTPQANPGTHRDSRRATDFLRPETASAHRNTSIGITQLQRGTFADTVVIHPEALGMSSVSREEAARRWGDLIGDGGLAIRVTSYRVADLNLALDGMIGDVGAPNSSKRVCSLTLQVLSDRRLVPPGTLERVVGRVERGELAMLRASAVCFDR